MSHKLNSAVAEIGVEIGKDSFDVAGQDKRDEMHSEASSSSQPSIITRDQGRRGRPRVPSVTAIRKVCSIPEGDDKSGVVQCKISAEPVSVVGHKRTKRHLGAMSALPPKADIAILPPYVRLVPILLQKSLMVLANSDSVALIRFAAESGDDGAAQSRPRSAVLLVLS